MKHFLFCLLFLFTSGTFAQSDSLSVISWNVFLRPGILNDGQKDRVDSIAKWLANSDADVLVLEEVFHRKSRKKLIEELNAIYPHNSRRGKTGFWGVSSGLLIFSKDSIIEEKHRYFSKATGSDKMAKKGGIAVVIQRDSIRIKIIGTHLQAGDGDERLAIRSEQIEELSRLDEESDSVDLTLFCGDFNIHQKDKNYLFLLEKLRSINQPVSGSIKATSNFPDHDLFEAKGEPKWIDFILVKTNNRVKKHKSEILEPKAKIRGRKGRVSDHNPIKTIICW